MEPERALSRRNTGGEVSRCLAAIDGTSAVMKKRAVLLATIGGVTLLLLMPVGYYSFFALVRHEHFFHGLPSSHWGRAIKQWPHDSPPPSSIPYLDLFLTYLGLRNNPAVLGGDVAAVPVLLDLIWNADDQIASPATHALTLTCMPPSSRFDLQFSGEYHAERVQNRILVVAKNHAGDSRRLILIEDKGRLLDSVECSIDPRLRLWGYPIGSVRVERCETPQPDGAQFTFRYLPAAGRTVPGHMVVHGEQSQIFHLPKKLPSAEWEEKGLCRVAIRDDRLEVVWPPLADED
jgi:hypothetical protein